MSGLTDSKNSKGALETWLEESWALDEMDSLIRERDMIDREHVKSLSILRQSVAPAYAGTNISVNRNQFLRQIDDEIKAYGSKNSMVAQLADLECSLKGSTWAEFRNLLLAAEEAKEQYSKTLENVKDCINPAQFWARVAQADYWVDLRLPREDLLLRASVNQVNIRREAAFEFYQKKRTELIDYHQRRLAKVNEILGIVTAGSTYTDSLSHHSDLSRASIVSSEGDIESPDDVRGPFSPLLYINFLNDGKKGLPIFGSELDSGSGKLGKLILGTPNDLHSPPIPIFVPPMVEGGDIREYVKCAFHLEELCVKRPVYDALRSVTERPELGYQVDKGWLLGLMLVNLPKQLIFLNEERIRAFRTSLPRDQITFLFQKGTQEYEFFKLLWRHTDDVNVQLAASAITQARETEKILADIRSKWQIELDMPLPSHRKWPSRASEDDTRGLPGKLLGRPRRSTGSRSGY